MEQERQFPRGRFLLIFVGLMCINLVAAIDCTAVSVTVPTIAADLNASSVQAYWIGTAFLLASAVFQPVFASLSHAFGRKAMTLLALLIFVSGTVVCGKARSVAILLTGRTVQGVGGGAFLTMTYVVIADLMPLEDLQKGIGVIAAVWLVGTSLGPVIGGGCTTHGSWRWIFWLCLPPAGIGLVLIACFMNTGHEAMHPAQAFKTADWVGTGLFLPSMTFFLVGASWGGSKFPWTSWQTLAPMFVGAAGVCGWAMYEHLVPTTPMVPQRVFGRQNAAICYIGTVFMGMAQLTTIYYLPLYYEFLKEYSALLSGVCLIPICVSCAVTAISVAVYSSRNGRCRSLIQIAWVLQVLGFGLFVLLTPTTSVPEYVFISLISAAGSGILFPTLSQAAVTGQQSEDFVIAYGLSPFFRAVGQSFGIVVGNTIRQNVLRSKLQSGKSEYLKSQAAALSKDSLKLGVILESLPHGSPEKLEIQQRSTKACTV